MEQGQGKGKWKGKEQGQQEQMQKKVEQEQKTEPEQEVMPCLTFYSMTTPGLSLWSYWELTTILDRGESLKLITLEFGSDREER